jgi:PPOX class probable F420-dependent enzyme
VKQRDRVAMDEAEVRALLAAQAKLQLATINPDGTAHLVTMFFALHQERIAFWTYRSAQKARNLARDPRLTCLVEDGQEYFELRGVQVAGVAEPIEEPAAVAGIGRLIAARMPGIGGMVVTDGADGLLDEYVLQAARKRIAYLVTPTRITTWDHRKLVT